MLKGRLRLFKLRFLRYRHLWLPIPITFLLYNQPQKLLRIKFDKQLLPNTLYVDGASKTESSTTLQSGDPSASRMHDTLGAAASDPNIFPKVILAFSTWNNGISM